jgi:ATP adenylyltransferase
VERNDNLPEIIWAPWRIDYILQAEKDEGCFLCRALESDEDEANLVLERRENCFAIFNRYPYNNGHMLIAPNAHKADLSDLDESELLEVMRLTRDVQERLRAAMCPHGFNIGINLGRCAGAGLPGHLHVHIVPRWNGDTNFMSATAHSKVIVQSLEALYQVLRGQDAT